MRTKLYTALAYGTLLVDVYLVLAPLAARMMKGKYSSWLPLFGEHGSLEMQSFPALVVATWTGILAIGCLKTQSLQSDNSHVPSTSWFVLVLSIIWLVNIVPIVTSFSWNVFLRGL